jgi:hypothetical protein
MSCENVRCILQGGIARYVLVLASEYLSLIITKLGLMLEQWYFNLLFLIK